MFLRVAAIHQVEVEQVAKPAHRQERYPDVFRGELGTVRGVNAKLHLKPDTIPKFCKPGPVRFALRPAEDRELQRMEKEGILEPVKFSQWATPLVCVPKTDGTVWLCGDYKVTVNPALHVDQHPIPALEQAFVGLAHGQRFTKIGLKSAAGAQLSVKRVGDDQNSERIVSTHPFPVLCPVLPSGRDSSTE